MKNKKSVIVLVGGGSGGHVVPLNSIARELLTKDSDEKILVVTSKNYLQRTEQIFKPLKSRHKGRIEIVAVTGGSFRRYGRGKFRELIDIPTQLKNILGLYKATVGVCQSKLLLRGYEPLVILCKGGTGALEFCFSARKKAPIVVHDSDSRPGLTNKTVAKWAKKHLQGMPKSVVGLNSEEVVGIPVNEGFRKYSNLASAEIRERLGLAKKGYTLLVTGGSLGAQKINRVVFSIIADLNALKIQVLHQVGYEEDLEKARAIKAGLKYPKMYKPFTFSNEMPELFAGSDVVIARAGATTIQELANAKKPAILIPASLTDQKKNAQIVEELGAGMVASQEALLKNPETLTSEVQYLLGNERLKEQLVSKLAVFEKRDAAKKIALILTDLKKVSEK